MATRLPPQSLEAEQAVLGAMLLSAKARHQVAEILKDASDFYREAHGRIWRVLRDMDDQDRPVDLVSLSEELKQRGLLEAVGGMSYLALLLDAVPTATNAEYYARIVEQKAILRALLDLGVDLAQRAYDPESDPADLRAFAEERIFNLRKGEGRTIWRSSAEILQARFDEAGRRASEEDMGTLRGHPTGLTRLDFFTKGLQPKKVLCIGGRPATGKTAFGITVTVNAVKKWQLEEDRALEQWEREPEEERSPKPRRKLAAVFSVEMEWEEVGDRMLSMLAEVEADKLQENTLTDSDLARMARAMGEGGHLPIWVDDTSVQTVPQMRSRVRSLCHETGHDPGLVVIDYIQLLHGRETRNRKQGSRHDEIDVIMGDLRAMAKELNCPVLLLSQLSRQVEYRKPPRPRVSDLRDSGAVDAACNTVILLYEDPEDRAFMRNVYSRSGGDAQQAPMGNKIISCVVAKNRGAPTGAFRLLFQGAYTRFVNLHPHWESADIDAKRAGDYDDGAEDEYE